MDQKKRILIAGIILVVILGIVLGVDFLQRQQATKEAPADMPPGSIPIFVDGGFVASFVPDDLSQLPAASFVDAEEGKTQDGWLLRDVLLLYLGEDNLQDETQVTVSSSSREKSRSLSWAEIDQQENMVMFDLSGRGTLKLVSTLPGFDIRDSWIQDVDKIEITSP
ncbi:MAG TPA: hypothetical protein PKL78_04490 [Anaerolineales bacterium]|nr:hypothetical protein [Anaerolineales bacterium]HNN12790.1 hypothetical protein [Anaerolineales bacterium]